MYLKNLPVWRQKIESFLISNINIGQNPRIIDIGSGLSTEIITKHIGVKPDCIDKNNPNVKYRFDITKPIDLAEQFDIVTCCEVFEHVINPFDAARNILPLCKPGGFILVTVPCDLDYHGNVTYGDYWRFMKGSIQCLFPNNRVDEELFCQGNEYMPIGVCAKIYV